MVSKSQIIEFLKPDWTKFITFFLVRATIGLVGGLLFAVYGYEWTGYLMAPLHHISLEWEKQNLELFFPKFYAPFIHKLYGGLIITIIGTIDLFYFYLISCVLVYLIRKIKINNFLPPAPVHAPKCSRPRAPQRTPIVIRTI
jgi:hypothetical protein